MYIQNHVHLLIKYHWYIRVCISVDTEVCNVKPVVTTLDILPATSTKISEIICFNC